MVRLLTGNTKRGGVAMMLALDLPERPHIIIQDRVWNRINKDAMRKALEFHHKEHMPRHFKRDARSRYRYTPRKPNYVKHKQNRFKQGGLDLVYTGATRDQILKPQGWNALRVGGTAVARTLKGTLQYRFSFADKIRAHHLANSVRFHSDPLAKRNELRKNARRNRARRQEATTQRVRVTIEHMRRELMAMTPDEAEAIRDVYQRAVFDAIEALPKKRRKLKAGGTEKSFLSLVGSGG